MSDDLERKRIDGLLITLVVLIGYIAVSWLIFIFYFFSVRSSPDKPLLTAGGDILIPIAEYSYTLMSFSLVLAIIVVANIFMVIPWQDASFEDINRSFGKLQNLSTRARSSVLVALSILTVVFVIVAVFLTGGSYYSPFSHMLVSLGAIGAIMAKNPKIKLAILLPAMISFILFSFLHIKVEYNEFGNKVLMGLQAFNGIAAMLTGILSAQKTQISVKITGLSINGEKIPFEDQSQKS